MKFDELIRKRASVKKYTSKKPSPHMITAGVNAAETAPSAGNTQCLLYIMIDDPETIEQLAKAARQDYIRKIPWVVVILSNPKQFEKLFDKRAEKFTKHYVGAAIQTFLLKMTDQGLASNWIGSFSEVTVQNILSIPDGIGIEALITIGYELPPGKAKQRPRYALDNRLFFDAWGNKFYKPLSKVRRGDI